MPNTPKIPMSDEQVLHAARHVWARYEAVPWGRVPPTERVLMAYANPSAAWGASDDLLAEFALRYPALASA